MKPSGADRSQKLQRLHSLRRKVPYASKSALHGILADIHEHGLPEMLHPKQMQEATQTFLAGMNGYGPLFKEFEATTAKGGVVKFLLLNVVTLLHAVCQQGGCFYRLLKQCCMTSKGPIKMCFYSDEIVPGNVLAARTERKSWCIYMSCADFPSSVLSMQDAWLTVCILRSNVVASLEGSISQVFKILFTDIFLNEQLDAKSGVWMPGPEGGFHLQFLPGFIIQDGAAHKFMWAVKGDSGSKYCLLCGNMRAHNRQDEERILMHCYADLHLSTDDEIWDSWTRLAERKATCTSKQFEQWQKASGWTFSSAAIFSAARLRPYIKPAMMFMHDWMHGCLSNGTLGIAAWLLFMALQAAGMDILSIMAQYMNVWVLPAALAGIKLADLFSEKRLKSCREANKLKGTASELLCLNPILAFYVRTCVASQEALQQEVAAFLNMSHMVDLLQSASQGHAGVSPAQLREAADQCISSMFAAGWEKHITRKMHWLLHFGDHYEKHKKLPGTFCMERKHKAISRYATSIMNVRSYERSLYEEVVAHELFLLQEVQHFDMGMSLLNPRPASRKLLNVVKEALQLPGLDAGACLSAASMKLQNGGMASKGDVCFLVPTNPQLAWGCGEIWAHLSVQGKLWSVVSEWSLLQYNPESHSALWQEQEQPIFVEASDIIAAVVYSKARHGVRTLVPYHLRP